MDGAVIKRVGGFEPSEDDINEAAAYMLWDQNIPRTKANIDKAKQKLQSDPSLLDQYLVGDKPSATIDNPENPDYMDEGVPDNPKSAMPTRARVERGIREHRNMIDDFMRSDINKEREMSNSTGLPAPYADESAQDYLKRVQK